MDTVTTHRTCFRTGVGLALMLIVGAFAPDPAMAQTAPSEYELKTAFIYQFLSYVSWTDSATRADGTILIGVVGAPELAGNLSMLSSRPGESAHVIEVRSLLADGDPGDLHVLFVGADAAGASDALLQGAVSAGVLTITEELPRPSHSIINFEIIDGKVRFDIALGLARQNGLDISARLLQVALRVMDP
jgi:hypothetical protein